MPARRPTPAGPRPDPLWDHLRELWPDLLILASIAGVVWFFDATLGHLGAGVVVGLLAGRGPVLFVDVLVEVTTGADPQNEHDESVLLDFVHHPVATDTNAAPARRAGQGHRSERSRFLAQVLDSLEHSPAGGDVKSADLLAG